MTFQLVPVVYGLWVCVCVSRVSVSGLMVSSRGRRCEDLCRKLVKCDQTASQLIMQDLRFGSPALSAGIIMGGHSVDRSAASPCGVIPAGGVCAENGGGGAVPTEPQCHHDECLRGGGMF